MLALIIRKLRRCWISSIIQFQLVSSLTAFQKCELLILILLMNIRPQFGEIRLSDLDLYQLLQASDKAIFKLLRPDTKVNSSYLQLDHSQLLAVELPVLTDKVNIDKELNELVKTLPNVNYRNGLYSGYLIQIIKIFEPGY